MSAPDSHPQVTMVGLWGIISSKQGFLDCTKNSPAFRNACHKVYPTRDGNQQDIATTDGNPGSSFRSGFWAWGQAVKGQQPVWLSCIQPALVSISKVGTEKSITEKQEHEVFWLKLGE